MRVMGAIVLCLAAPAAAGAQVEGTVTFDATVDATCAVTSTTDGDLDVSADYTLMSSEIGAGASGEATVVSTDDDNTVTVIAPAAFASAPSGGGDNVVFAALYDLSGDTSATDVAAGAQTTLNFGAATVTVDTSATKSSGIFPAGDYTLEVTVRCTVV